MARRAPPCTPSFCLVTHRFMLTEIESKLAAYAAQPGANQSNLEFVRQEIALLAEPERAQGRLHELHGRGRPHLWRVATEVGVLAEVQQLTQAYINHVLDAWIEHCAAPGDDPYFAGDMTALSLLMPEHARVSERDATSTVAASRAAVRLASDPAGRARARAGFLANFQRRYLATTLLPDEVAAATEKLRELRAARATGADMAPLQKAAGWGQSGQQDAYDPSSVTWHSPGLQPVKEALTQLGIYAEAWAAWQQRLEAALSLWEGNTPEGIARRLSTEAAAPR